VKITIDTKEDSHAEIQKVIKMLSSLVNGEEVMSNQGDIFDLDNTTDTNQKSSDIFGDDSSSIVSNDSSLDSTDSSESSDSSGGGMFNMFSPGSSSNTSPESTTEETQEDKKDDDENEKIDIDIPDVEEYR